MPTGARENIWSSMPAAQGGYLMVWKWVLSVMVEIWWSSVTITSTSVALSCAMSTRGVSREGRDVKELC